MPIYDSVMNKTYENGLKIKDIVSIIEKCEEKRKRNKDRGLEEQIDIQVPGMGYTGCKYYRIKEEEKQESAPLKNLPLDIIIQQKFLQDLNKNKNSEQLWFKKLEEELEKLEVDDALLNVPKHLQTSANGSNDDGDRPDSQLPEISKPPSQSVKARDLTKQ